MANWTTEERENGSKREVLEGIRVVDEEEITWGMVRQGCAHLDIDPDRVLSGESIELPEVPTAPKAQRFFELVVVNHEEFPPLSEMQFHRAKCLLGALTDLFINASAQASPARKTT